MSRFSFVCALSGSFGPAGCVEGSVDGGRFSELPSGLLRFLSVEFEGQGSVSERRFNKLRFVFQTDHSNVTGSVGFTLKTFSNHSRYEYG